MLTVHLNPWLPECEGLVEMGWVLPSRFVADVGEAHSLQWGPCSLVQGSPMVVVDILHHMHTGSSGCYIRYVLGNGAFAAQTLVVED